MEELRRLFAEVGDVGERVSALRDERFLAILQEKACYSLPPGDRLLLHIVPLSSQTMSSVIHVGRANENQMSFRPMGKGFGFTPKFNVHGFANTTTQDGYTQVFRNGVIEAVQVSAFVGTIRDRAVVSGRLIEETLFEAVPRYIEGLRVLDVSPPLFIAVTLIGVGSASVICDRTFPAWISDLAPKLSDPALKLPICVIDDYGTPDKYTDGLKPAFDALWNAGNRSEWGP